MPSPIHRLSRRGRPGPRRRPSPRSCDVRAVLVGLVALVAGQVVMVLIMTMTRSTCGTTGMTLATIGIVLFAHLFGMLRLSPISGRLTDRFGSPRIIGAGLLTLAAAALLSAVAPPDGGVLLTLALFLLGYGWNRAMVAASAMLTHGLDIAERTRRAGRGPTAWCGARPPSRASPRASSWRARRMRRWASWPSRCCCFRPRFSSFCSPGEARRLPLLDPRLIGGVTVRLHTSRNAGPCEAGTDPPSGIVLGGMIKVFHLDARRGRTHGWRSSFTLLFAVLRRSCCGHAPAAPAAGRGSTPAGSPHRPGAAARTGALEPPASDVAFEFWTPFTGADGDEMETLVAQFNSENPNVQVTLQRLPEYYTQINNAVAAGTPPAMMIMHIDQLALFAAERRRPAGQRPRRASSACRADDFSEAVWAGTMWKDEQYSIPLDVHPATLYYNKQYVPEAPTDRRRFEAALQACKDAGITGPVWSNHFFSAGLAVGQPLLPGRRRVDQRGLLGGHVQQRRRRAGQHVHARPDRAGAAPAGRRGRRRGEQLRVRPELHGDHRHLADHASVRGASATTSARRRSRRSSTSRVLGRLAHARDLARGRGRHAPGRAVLHRLAVRELDRVGQGRPDPGAQRGPRGPGVRRDPAHPRHRRAVRRGSVPAADPRLRPAPGRPRWRQREARSRSSPAVAIRSPASTRPRRPTPRSSRRTRRSTGTEPG